jgi:hypothetical protein
MDFIEAAVATLLKIRDQLALQNRGLQLASGHARQTTEMARSLSGVTNVSYVEMMLTEGQAIADETQALAHRTQVMYENTLEYLEILTS